jgi:hypothetical protein
MDRDRTLQGPPLGASSAPNKIADCLAAVVMRALGGCVSVPLQVLHRVGDTSGPWRA